MSTARPAPASPLAGDELAGLHLRRRADIDGLRGIAVVAVVVYHFFPSLVPGGFVGVDVFFVISGFVITNLLIRQQPLSLKAMGLFWGHRVRRLFPALALVIVATLLAGWFVLWPAQLANLGSAAAWSAAMLGNVFAFRETTYFAAEPTWNPLLNLWSLGVEEQFYLVWPAVLALLWLMLRGRRVGVVIVLAGLGVLSWVAGMLHGRDAFGPEATSAVFYLPWFRAWELLAGALVAVLLSTVAGSRPNPAPRWAQSTYWVALAAIPIALWWPYETQRPSEYALVAVLATSVVIGLGPRIHQADAVVGNPVLLWLGKISYPLYLWHWPVMSLALAVGLAWSLTTRSLLVGLSVVLAWATWGLVERRVQGRAVRTPLVLTLAGAMVAAGGLGLVVSQAGLAKASSSDLAAELARYDTDPRPDYGIDGCFIEQAEGQRPEDLVKCLPKQGEPPGVLLWGDSHAASMSEGIQAALGDTPFTQLTTAGCEPSLTEDAPSDVCNIQNVLALKAIKEGKFTDVIVAAWWRGEYDPQDLVRLVRRIKQISDTHVTVVGPLPRWSPALNRAWSQSEIEAMDGLPLFTRKGLMDEPFLIDRKLRAALKSEGIYYVSPIDTLCRSEGCRVTIDGTPQTLTTWDYGHLTSAASVLLGRPIIKNIDRDGR